MESFEDLLYEAKSGREWAFSELWRSLHPPLLRYLRVAAPDAMDDLASETWLQVARGLDRFKGNEDDFRRWLFTIARHQAIDASRRRRRSRSDSVPPEALSGISAEPDPADVVQDGLTTDAALALIARLPKEQAEAVTLRVVAGLAVEDVARILGKRPGAIRVLTHRGLRRLAEMLAPQPPE